MALNFTKASYARSAGAARDFLRDGLPQFAFAGRSNVGKSSVINRLVNRKNLAYVGASPGKTTQINYFLIDGGAYLVDLPGYGYAKVSQSEKERWAKLMETYFQEGADAGRAAAAAAALWCLIHLAVLTAAGIVFGIISLASSVQAEGALPDAVGPAAPEEGFDLTCRDDPESCRSRHAHRAPR